MSADRDARLAEIKLRVGRKVGRTLYQQLGPEPSDDDPLVGVMDTPELAALVAALLSERDEALRELDRWQTPEGRKAWAGLHEGLKEANRERDAAVARADRLEQALRDTASAAGHPDPAEACRNVIAIARAALSGKDRQR